jgi:hypothetical protein
MKLLGHTNPEMTMRYVDVALTDLQREFQLARSKPRHLVPQPKTPLATLRAGLDGVIDSFLVAQHMLEMFRRTLSNGLHAPVSTDSLIGSRKSSWRANFPHPENGQTLAGYADHPVVIA